MASPRGTQQPLLRSAHYGAFLALRRLNRDAEAAEMLARFQALERHPQAVVAEFKDTRMGPLSEAITVDLASDRPPPAPSGARFASLVPLVDDSGIACAEAGRRDRSPWLISTAMKRSTCYRRRDRGPRSKRGGHEARPALRVDRAHPLARVANVRAALWGDLDDDGLIDVVLCRPEGRAQIWKQSPAGRWVDATAASGVRLARTDIVDGAMFDADHDGDLDIWLVNAAGPNELLNNDGGGRFRAIGAATGVAGEAGPLSGSRWPTSITIATPTWSCSRPRRRMMSF